MGPRGGDELNLILPGKNYGWPQRLGGRELRRRADPRPSTRPRFEPPKLCWVPSISPASLLIYSGNLFPQWKGDALIGALSGEALIRVHIQRRSGAEGRAMGHGRTASAAVGQGPDGAIYLLEDGDGGAAAAADAALSSERADRGRQRVAVAHPRRERRA